ncbi:hypothetical protein [Paraburkholderia lycopersici]|nr:hypothetical protein [Paraburkholderia lycopersici]
MICPQCGAKQLPAGPRTSPPSESAAPEWHDGFARHSHSHWSPAAFGFGGAQQYSEYPARDEAREGHRSWLPFYAVGSVVSVVFLLGAYTISHRAERAPSSGGQVVEGAVFVPKGNVSAPTVKPPASRSASTTVEARVAPPPAAAAPPSAVAHVSPSPAHVPPPVVAHASPPLPVHVPPPPLSVPVPQRQYAPPVPTVIAHTEAAQRGIAARKSAGEERTLAAKTAAKASANARADVARSLASARANLDKSSLAPARSAIMTALAEQPGNGYALQMQAELASREQERDSLLGYARLCAREGQWVCAWHNAGHALTVDSSSSEAKDMLARSIAQQGRGAVRQVDSGPPGPPIDPN